MENDLVVEEAELSMEWIHDFEKMYSENAHYPREKMDKMNVYYLYVENGWITRMVPRKVAMDSVLSDLDMGVYLKELGREGLSGFVKERLLETTELISNEELVSREVLKMSEKKFVLSEMMLFNVDMEPGNISEFGGNSGALFGDGDGMFQTFSCFVGGEVGSEENWGGFSGIEWKDSVFIFHCVNAVYFVYQLLSVLENNTEKEKKKVEPILIWDRPGGGAVRRDGNNKTKRVHFAFEYDSDDSSYDSDDSDVGWGKGKWIRNRQRNRTRKMNHVLDSSLIRQLFSS